MRPQVLRHGQQVEEASEYNPFIEDDTPPGRPVFLTILGLLHLGGGVFILWLLVRYWNAFEKLNLSGITTRPHLAFAISIIGGVSVAGAIGAFARKRWGWWLLAFYYMHAILRYGNALFLGWQLQDEPDVPEGLILRSVIKYSGRIIVSALILRYLFAKRVIAYFGWERVSWTKRLGTLLSAAIGVGSLGFLIGLIG